MAYSWAAEEQLSRALRARGLRLIETGHGMLGDQPIRTQEEKSSSVKARKTLNEYAKESEHMRELRLGGMTEREIGKMYGASTYNVKLRLTRWERNRLRSKHRLQRSKTA